MGGCVLTDGVVLTDPVPLATCEETADEFETCEEGVTDADPDVTFVAKSELDMEAVQLADT